MKTTLGDSQSVTSCVRRRGRPPVPLKPGLRASAVSSVLKNPIPPGAIGFMERCTPTSDGTNWWIVGPAPPTNLISIQPPVRVHHLDRQLAPLSAPRGAVIVVPHSSERPQACRGGDSLALGHTSDTQYHGRQQLGRSWEPIEHHRVDRRVTRGRG
jgi:hypothetical protein